MKPNYKSTKIEMKFRLSQFILIAFALKPPLCSPDLVKNQNEEKTILKPMSSQQTLLEVTDSNFLLIFS